MLPESFREARKEVRRTERLIDQRRKLHEAIGTGAVDFGPHLEQAANLVRIVNARARVNVSIDRLNSKLEERRVILAEESLRTLEPLAAQGALPPGFFEEYQSELSRYHQEKPSSTNSIVGSTAEQKPARIPKPGKDTKPRGQVRIMIELLSRTGDFVDADEINSVFWPGESGDNVSKKRSGVMTRLKEGLIGSGRRLEIEYDPAGKPRGTKARYRIAEGSEDPQKVDRQKDLSKVELAIELLSRTGEFVEVEEINRTLWPEDPSKGGTGRSVVLSEVKRRLGGTDRRLEVDYKRVGRSRPTKARYRIVPFGSSAAEEVAPAKPVQSSKEAVAKDNPSNAGKEESEDRGFSQRELQALRIIESEEFVEGTVIDRQLWPEGKNIGSTVRPQLIARLRSKLATQGRILESEPGHRGKIARYRVRPISGNAPVAPDTQPEDSSPSSENKPELTRAEKEIFMTRDEKEMLGYMAVGLGEDEIKMFHKIPVPRQRSLRDGIYKALGIEGNKILAVLAGIDHGILNLDKITRGFKFRNYMILPPDDRALFDFITARENASKGPATLASEYSMPQKGFEEASTRVFKRVEVKNRMQAVVFKETLDRATASN